MKTALDSNILLDLRGSARAGDEERSFLALRRSSADSSLVICTVVYAEISPRFASQSELDQFIGDLNVMVEDVSRNAAFLAGRALAKYKSAGGKRDRILPDFLIAGHAMAQAHRLLTRDRGFFRKYFGELLVVEP